MNMPRLVFKHIRNTDNIGDRSCCPLDYLPFTDAVAMDLDEPTPRCDVVIFGGGKIFGSLASKLTPNDRLSGQRIAWGVSTVQTNPLSIKYALSRRSMTLIGSRDFGDQRYDFAPCVSCMSPLFDKSYDAQHPVVLYMHHGKTSKMGMDVPANIPVLDNHCETLASVIAFLGSGETVVSNSYHGVYWALLLGKRVLCVPFSRKFHHYRLPPGYAGPKDWMNRLAGARRQDEMLDICRESTVRFEKRVRALLEGAHVNRVRT
jgi:hypothetical protein